MREALSLAQKIGRRKYMFEKLKKFLIGDKSGEMECKDCGCQFDTNSEGNQTIVNTAESKEEEEE